jgi:hypothetical protein
LFGSEVVGSGDCNKNGKCLEDVTLQATFDENPCVNQNWHPNFTASAFWGVSVLTWEDNQGVDQVLPILDLCIQPQPGQSYNCTQQAF